MQAAPQLSRILEEWLAGEFISILRGAAPALEAVVLGGSFARGTEMWLRREDTSLSLLSDLDVYCVLSSETQNSRSALQKCLDEIEAPGGARLDAGIVDPEFFGRLGHSLPAFQLAGGYRILWAVDGRAPELTRPVGSVEADDALLLLHNRMAEAIEAELFGESWAGLSRWKLWMDAPLAFLAAAGRYEPDRPDQLAQLRELSQSAGLGSHCATNIRRLAEMGRQASHPLAAESLLNLGGTKPPSAAESDSHVGLLWAATLRVCMAEVGAVEALRWAGQATAAERSELACEWLRREALPQRLRRARHYAPLAPPWISPWWRHGFWGVGPEIVDVALALHSRGHGLKDLDSALGALGLAEDPTMLLSSRAGWRQETTG